VGGVFELSDSFAFAVSEVTKYLSKQLHLRLRWKLYEVGLIILLKSRKNMSDKGVRRCIACSFHVWAALEECSVPSK
jgi:hypothetical protein